MAINMILAGIDYGAKNIGLAVSDPEETLAFPHSVIENNERAIDKIVQIIGDKKIEKVILGESVNLDGKPNKIMKDIEKFKRRLEAKVNLPIIYVKEHFSTLEAKQIQGSHSKIDSSAAALILKSHLERNK